MADNRYSSVDQLEQLERDRSHYEKIERSNAGSVVALAGPFDNLLISVGKA
jgi:hypothetical protein